MIVANNIQAQAQRQLDASQLKFQVASTSRPVPKPGSAELWAQNVATDHMVTCRWTTDGGWDAPILKPFGDLTISPLASCLHYATQCFEGMKVYQWLPEPGDFRYIRPALIGTGSQLGIQIPKEAVLMVTMVCWPDFSSESPPGQEPRSDLRLITSKNDTIRAWPGGFGHAKVGANYGPSFASHCEAQQAGYDQILWLFGQDGEVTEAGASNFFAIVKDAQTSKPVLITAPLTEKVILDGVTRRSVLDLVKSRLAGELEARELKFTAHDLVKAWRDGLLLEAFVSGTAFFIKRVSTIRFGDEDIDLPQQQGDKTEFGALIKGVLGRYYSTRHTLGQYRSACVTASYTVNSANKASSNQAFLSALEGALQATIRQHAGLRYGISEQTERGVPMFKQLRAIDQGDVLEIISSQHRDIPDETLSEALGKFHANLWLPEKPAWKVVVFEYLAQDPTPGLNTISRLDIAFFAHHAIADGLSGIAFHTSLIENLKFVPDQTLSPSWPLELDQSQEIPPTVEECMDISPCNCTVCGTQNVTIPSIWAGGDILSTPVIGFQSRVRIITVPQEALSSLLQKGKLAKVTLTGLLHAYICNALRRALNSNQPVQGSEQGFQSVTPFQIRQHTGASDREILNHISYLTTYVPHGELEKIITYERLSDSEEQEILELARFFSHDITIKVKAFPHGSNMAAQLSQIEDPLRHCQSQSGQKRQYTYELSNLGSTSSILSQEGSGIKLEKLAFTQCGFVAGPALGFNCVSVMGGPLTLSITWQSGIVSDSLVERVINELEVRIGGAP
ncbi:related to branched-chain amino acids aminotransferase [Fusarium torulosum]|uniref:Branched-chain-amino-acid aminotransferase n=1 Tax=Fusarium torulosum TaxID=33205 RepID=A0AAE8SD10_9HYPO|nr:related to branched-chain amino acids aminotransferase [Fusarium torulosum]